VETFVGWCARQHRFQQTERKYMLWTICVILIILWLLGVISGTAIGGLIHILLVVAIIMILVNFISGRKR
jgi:hypothetical protein